MRKFEYRGRKYRLPEKDYRKLLDKLDTSKAYLGKDTWGDEACRIDNACICPGGSHGNCYCCPLGPRDNNCITLLTVAASVRMPRGMNFYVDYLTYPKNSKKAVEYLNAARQSLLALAVTH